MPLKQLIPGNTAYASDVNQLILALNGGDSRLGGDIGTLTTIGQQLAPAAPSLSVVSTAGNLNGTYYYSVVLATGWLADDGTFHITGFAPGATSASVAPANQQVQVSQIALGGLGTVARILYRTAAGGSAYEYCAWIADNSTTVYTDNLADASLGTGMPAVVGTPIPSALPTSNSTGTSLTFGPVNNPITINVPTNSFSEILFPANASATDTNQVFWSRNNSLGVAFRVNSGGVNLLNAYSNGTVSTKNNTLEDGSGNMTATGTLSASEFVATGTGYAFIANPQGTATSSANYWSQSLKLEASNWNGSSATTVSGLFQLDNNGVVHWFAGTNSVMTVDASGNVTTAGDINGKPTLSTQIRCTMQASMNYQSTSNTSSSPSALSGQAIYLWGTEFTGFSSWFYESSFLQLTSGDTAYSQLWDYSTGAAVITISTTATSLPSVIQSGGFQLPTPSGANGFYPRIYVSAGTVHLWTAHAVGMY